MIDVRDRIKQATATLGTSYTSVGSKVMSGNIRHTQAIILAPPPEVSSGAVAYIGVLQSGGTSGTDEVIKYTVAVAQRDYGITQLGRVGDPNSDILILKENDVLRARGNVSGITLTQVYWDE